MGNIGGPRHPTERLGRTITEIYRNLLARTTARGNNHGTLNRVTHRGSGLTRIDRDGWQQTHPDGQCCTPPADAVTVVSRSVVSVVRTSPSASLTALLLP